jgi:hypothetical protein
MYFALESFKKDSSFENIYCEQDKMDFEIWSTSNFVGFQVKTKPDSLSAKEINKIFLYYLNKSIKSGKRNRAFRFVFGVQPTDSRYHLFTVVQGSNRGARYSRQIQKFIDAALQNIPAESMLITFHCFDEQQIKHLVFSLSAEILKEKLGSRQDIQTEVVRTFITKFRDEIDQISCKSQDVDRVYSTASLGLLVNNFLDDVKIEQSEKEGEHTIEIRVPKRLSNIVEAKISIKPIGIRGDPESDTPKEAIKS